MNNSGPLVEQTTFNFRNQADDVGPHTSIYHWLDALYAEVSDKKFDPKELHHIISLKNLEEKIAYTFVDKDQLIQSLCQSTFCHEIKNKNFQSNERLEFIGDSLLNFLITDILFEMFPELPEGDLSRLRGALVNEDKFSDLALSLNLPENILLGKGEFKSKGYLKKSILANTFEALFGAIYFDSQKNLEVLRAVFQTVIKNFDLQNETSYFSLEELIHYDSKTALQELTMKTYGMLPDYQSIETAAGFKVQVLLNGKILAEDTGISKKKLEKKLARKILEQKLY